MAADPLIEALPIAHRLALAYAPAQARPATLALLALDCRLAGIVRAASEPLLGQLRLSWWRDRLGENPDNWPEGEPLLKLLGSWGDHTASLIALVDGWEGMLDDPPLAGGVIAQFADGRAQAFGGLAKVVGADPDEAKRAARNWALIDLSGKLGDRLERAGARNLALQQDWSRPGLPRSMRALVVLHGLAWRAMRRGDGDLVAGGWAALAALRLGLLGR